jgi:hypothetical protein
MRTRVSGARSEDVVTDLVIVVVVVTVAMIIVDGVTATVVTLQAPLAPGAGAHPTKW